MYKVPTRLKKIRGATCTIKVELFPSNYNTTGNIIVMEICKYTQLIKKITLTGHDDWYAAIEHNRCLKHCYITLHLHRCYKLELLYECNKKLWTFLCWACWIHLILVPLNYELCIHYNAAASSTFFHTYLQITENQPELLKCFSFF